MSETQLAAAAARIDVVSDVVCPWCFVGKRRLEQALAMAPDIAAEVFWRPYQLDGFRWLAFLQGAGLGGILADDMGLGKTVQTLALVARARAEGAAPFLVVAPTSVVSTWAHEAARFTPGLVVRTVTESQARRGVPLAELHDGADLVITSYTLYRMEVDDYLDRVTLVPLTMRTITSRSRLVDVLDEVREQGWALVDQELEEGVRSVAAPLRDANGRVIGAVNVSGQAARTTLERLRRDFLPELLATAERINADLARR